MRLNIDDRGHALLASIPAIGLYLGLQHFIQEERAFAIALCAFVFYALIVVKWASRHEASFWIPMAAFATLHMAALTLFELPHYAGPNSIAVLVAFADGFAMYAILGWIEKRS